MKTQKARRIWGSVDVLFAVVLAFAVFRGLPARVLWVDVPAALVALSFGVGGAALCFGAPWAKKLLRVATLTTTGIGALFIVVLCFGIGFLAGVHAPVGGGGALLGALIVLLLVPYLVVFPLVQYKLLGDR